MTFPKKNNVLGRSSSLPQSKLKKNYSSRHFRGPKQCILCRCQNIGQIFVLGFWGGGLFATFRHPISKPDTVKIQVWKGNIWTAKNTTKNTGPLDLWEVLSYSNSMVAMFCSLVFWVVVLFFLVATAVVFFVFVVVFVLLLCWRFTVAFIWQWKFVLDTSRKKSRREEKTKDKSKGNNMNNISDMCK